MFEEGVTNELQARDSAPLPAVYSWIHCHWAHRVHRTRGRDPRAVWAPILAGFLLPCHTVANVVAPFPWGSEPSPLGSLLQPVQHKPGVEEVGGVQRERINGMQGGYRHEDMFLKVAARKFLSETEKDNLTPAWRLLLVDEPHVLPT